MALIGSSRPGRTLTGARIACAAVLALAGTAIVHPQSTSLPTLPFPPVATFSILGFDPATGEVGGAVQPRVFSVRNGVDDSEEPLKELRRVVEKWNATQRRR